MAKNTSTQSKQHHATTPPVTTAYKPKAKGPNVAKAKEAVLALAVGAATEDTIGPVLKAWDYKAAGFKSLEHAVSVFLGVFPAGNDVVVPKASELRTLQISINQKTIKVQAVIQAARRAMARAGGDKLKPRDTHLTPERLNSRANRLMRDAIGADLIVTAISVLEATIKALKERKAKDDDRGHENAARTTTVDE